jgi:outer membrane receptor protein involved in Fe transport
VYRIATNAKTDVTTMGTSFGINYFFKDKYTLGFNYSFNQLNKKDDSDPIIPAFNTPKNKFNLSIGGSQLEYKKIKNVSFNVNFKWIEGFVYEGSPQFTGDVPTYWMLDAMISKEIPNYHTQIKLGASNLTNNLALQVYGGPRIGRMAYISLLFDISHADMKK